MAMRRDPRKKQIGSSGLLNLGFLALSPREFRKLRRPRPAQGLPNPDLLIEFPDLPRDAVFFRDRRLKKRGPQARRAAKK